jgi:hypothetical protein
MTSEKKPVDLHSIEPIFRSHDPEEVDSRKDADSVGMGVATATGSTPAAGTLAQIEDEPPPDPDDLDRLRRG